MSKTTLTASSAPLYSDQVYHDDASLSRKHFIPMPNHHYDSISSLLGDPLTDGSIRDTPLGSLHPTPA